MKYEELRNAQRADELFNAANLYSISGKKPKIANEPEWFEEYASMTARERYLLTEQELIKSEDAENILNFIKEYIHSLEHSDYIGFTYAITKNDDIGWATVELARLIQYHRNLGNIPNKIADILLQITGYTIISKSTRPLYEYGRDIEGSPLRDIYLKLRSRREKEERADEYADTIRAKLIASENVD